MSHPAVTRCKGNDFCSACGGKTPDGVWFRTCDTGTEVVLCHDCANYLSVLSIYGVWAGGENPLPPPARLEHKGRDRTTAEIRKNLEIPDCPKCAAAREEARLMGERLQEALERIKSLEGTVEWLTGGQP